MSFEAWNTPVSGNLYAEVLKNRGIPQKADLPTLGRGPAELRLSAASAPGPYRQAIPPKPMARIGELEGGMTVRPAIAIRTGMYYADDGTLRAIPFKQQPIGPVKTFPETGKDSWRAGNDGVIVDALNAHNTRHGFLPGDEQFMTPGLVKSWMMKEIGGHRADLERDPLTANHPGDWTADKERILGLRHRQAMTPASSIAAGLDWLLSKGTYSDAEANGALAGTYRGTVRALEKYKGLEKHRETPQQYAAKIYGLHRDSFGDDL